jgi:hypothetical protein
MFYLRRNNFLFKWIAIFAFLASSVAPSISRALAAHRSADNSLAYVCSTQGIKVSQASSESPNGLESSHHAFGTDSCGYCTLQSNYYLPSFKVFLSDTPESDNFYPGFLYQSPKLLFSWLKLPPRGPPSIS